LKPARLQGMQENSVRSPIIIFTDHENKTFNGLNANTSDRILRICWILFLEEYGVAFEYLPGKKKSATEVDTFFCLDIDSLKIQEKKQRSINKSLMIRKQQHH
jgi:hypothetical protein